MPIVRTFIKLISSIIDRSDDNDGTTSFSASNKTMSRNASDTGHSSRSKLVSRVQSPLTTCRNSPGSFDIMTADDVWSYQGRCDHYDVSSTFTWAARLPRYHTCVFDTPLWHGACGHSDNLRRVGSRFHSWWMFVPLVTFHSKLWRLQHTAHPAREDFQLHSTVRNTTVIHTVETGVLMLD